MRYVILFECFQPELPLYTVTVTLKLTRTKRQQCIIFFLIRSLQVLEEAFLKAYSFLPLLHKLLFEDVYLNIE